MSAGYSGTPLVKKLGIKPGARILALGPPDHYWDLLGELPYGASEASADDTEVEFIHLFVRAEDALGYGLERARARMAQNGMVWVSWPKKSSGVATGVGEADVRAAGLATGLVDVKICAVDEVWSGLKFVIRVADRT